MRNWPAAILPILLVLAALPGGAAAAPAARAPDDESTLRAMRAARREQARSHSLSTDKSGPARFGLLVIPVDFADARLPGGQAPAGLAERLYASGGESLMRYFKVASQNKLELAITLAPVIHLPESRRSYSDRDLNGFTRTRRLASEALTAVRDLGLEFRQLDIDGPDRRAGSGDDDGMVDGVLILHAGPGTENDPVEGLIQPLQFFLDVPVVSLGVGASFYAVASLQSGPGIWAHETAHLLGMEDRYDPLLRPSGAAEVESRGGLGRFSLMASGAWGTGGGWGAALPDAYSVAQMGWIPWREPVQGETVSLAAGQAGRVWTRGESGPEFFVVETRDPEAAAPFDAAVPGGQLLIYHVDETVPEGSWREDGPDQWHLRVGLIEADAEAGLRTGLDDGNLADLFPGTTGATAFGPATWPASARHDGAPSNVALSGITPRAGGVDFRVDLELQPAVAVSLGFGPGPAARPVQLEVAATGPGVTNVTVQMTALAGSDGGSFEPGGGTALTLDMVETGPGRWVPAVAAAWVPPAGLPAGSRTQFSVQVSSDGSPLSLETRTWVWSVTGTELDFRTDWPGEWVVDHPDGETGTTWHRWNGPPWLTADSGPVLACTASTFSSPDAWPQVTYQNRAYTTLTSAPLPAEVAAVRLTHAIEVEILQGSTAMDGGVVRWVGSDGAVVPAVPLEGYRGVISAASFNPLHGQAAFVADSLTIQDGVPLWRVDTIAKPASGTGPWRLQLAFAANTLWRGRGWFVADVQALTAADSGPVLQAVWAGALNWSWPAAIGATSFAVQSRADEGDAWRPVLSADLVPGPGSLLVLPADRLLPLLPGSTGLRHQVRVIVGGPFGPVAGAPTVVYRDGGAAAVDQMGLPWPNPAHGAVRAMVDIPSGQSAQLKIWDVRGRLVWTRRLGAGSQLVLWDGHDRYGARAAAGVYFMRLEGSGWSQERKVVLIP